MTLALLAILIVVVIGWLAPDLIRLRDFVWLRGYSAWMNERLAANGLWQSPLGLLMLLLPPLLLLALVDLLTREPLHGLLNFVLGVAVLYYVWGPRDLDVDADAAARAGTPVDRGAALDTLTGHEARAEGDAGSGQLVDAVFLAGLTRWFAPMFWFVLFGPVGALGYRLVQLLAQSPDLRASLPTAQSDVADRVHAALAWLPAQLMTLALALASDFDAVAKAWRAHHDAHGQGVLHLDLGFLSATARACVDVDDEAFIASDGSVIADAAVEEARRLLWRLLIVWLTFLAIVVLAGWSN
jgi:AmpE protein